MIANNSMVPVQNQFQPQTVEDAEVGGGYRSPFALARTIDDLRAAGQIFASSAFAPKGFQGEVGNCMIALDMANQLGMNVLTLMQQLYIIDGRPAVSTALANSLFNMQLGKKFSTIRLERGVEETIEYDVMVKGKDERGYTVYRPSGKKRTIPNHWAIAYTTNTKTGERFESQKVSVQTALDNGWLTKYQSKWQTLPELMCGYRAQAFLIRTFFPQVLLGMYFQDEMEDIAAEKSQIAVEVVQRPSSNPSSYVPSSNPAPAQIEAPKSVDPETVLTQEMNAAKTVEELKTIGAKVKNYAFPAQATERLRNVYLTRKEALSSKPQEVEAEVVKEEPAEALADAEVVAESSETKKPSRKPRAKKNAEVVEFDVNAVALRIQNATTADELAAIRSELKNDEKAGRVNSQFAEQLDGIIENRYVDLETEQNDVPSVNRSDMEANLYDLIREVKSQSTVEDLKRVIDKAAGWRDSGDIDAEMFSKVVEEAKRQSATFASSREINL